MRAIPNATVQVPVSYGGIDLTQQADQPFAMSLREIRSFVHLTLLTFCFLTARASVISRNSVAVGLSAMASAPGDAKMVGLPLHWSETNKLKWKTAIPFRGWSTPVIMGGQVWVTTAKVDGHDFYAVGLDADTGKILFNEHLFHTDNPEPLGNGSSMNCYATPSAVIEPGRVYVHFGSFGTACLDTKTGKTLWKRNDLPCRHYRGPSSSPVAFENLLILTMDGADLQYHVALDKRTGKTVWKTNRSVAWNDENVPGPMARDGDMRKAHSTPLIVTVSGKTQMISAGAKAASAVTTPARAREIWRVQYPDFSTAPRPLFDNGLAFIVTGLTKTELWAVKTDGKGDVTDSAVVWKLRTHIGKYSSPILADGLLYTAAGLLCHLPGSSDGQNRLDRTDRWPICGFPDLCRWTFIFLQPGWNNHRVETGTQIRGAGDQYPGERLHGFSFGSRQGSLSADKNRPVSG